MKQKVKDKLSEIMITYVGEFNDATTRDKLCHEIGRHLSSIGERGFLVRCNEDNNPPELVDDKKIKVGVWTKEDGFTYLTLGPDGISSS